MPEEIFVLSMTALISAAVVVTSIVRSTFKYLHAKNTRPQVESGGLTASELKHLLSEAVEDAVLPLHQQIENLEKQISRAALPPAREKALPEPHTEE